MDPKLAEIYGTNQASESDVEKLAAAELAEELSENDEANIDGMSDEQIEALAAQVLAGAEGEEQEQYEEESGVDPESLEKISEADYLGRVMAHSYVNELRSIDAEMQKEAAYKPSKEEMKAGKAHAKEIGGGARRFASNAANKAGKVGKAVASGAWNNKGKLGLGALAVGGAVGGRKLYKNHQAKQEATKTSSALDVLAEQRALEILAENGIDPNETEKVSSGEQEVLAQAVEERAYAMLQNAGYISEE